MMHVSKHQDECFTALLPVFCVFHPGVCVGEVVEEAVYEGVLFVREQKIDLGLDEPLG